MKNIIIGVLIAAAFFGAFFGALYAGLQRFEKHQCYVWQDYENQYENFESSEDMIWQCNQFNINLER